MSESENLPVQLELPRLGKAYPKDINKDRASMICILRKWGCWIPATSFNRIAAWSDRYCRELAQDCGEIISGNEGYKLTKLATPEEVAMAAGRLRSQGRKMIRRSIKILNYWHKSPTRERIAL